MNAKHASGFTLLELMITVFIAALLLGFGIPSFREFQRNNAIAAAANDLVSATLASRAEAVKRQVPVTLCANSGTPAAPVCSPTGAGASGYFVFVDENGNTDPATGVPIITDATDGNAVLNNGETPLLVRAAPGGAINVFANTGVVSYGPNGFRRLAITGLAAQPAIFNVLYCDDRGNRVTSTGSTARVVRIDQTGRGQTLRDVVEVTPAIATIPGAGALCP